MKPSTFIAGIAAGIALMVACEHSSPIKRAEAAPSDCAVWQYTSQEIAVDANGGTYTDLSGNVQPIGAQELPSGWEPFAVDTSGHIVFRRCKP